MIPRFTLIIHFLKTFLSSARSYSTGHFGFFCHVHCTHQKYFTQPHTASSKSSPRAFAIKRRSRILEAFIGFILLRSVRTRRSKVFQREKRSVSISLSIFLPAMSSSFGRNISPKMGEKCQPCLTVCKCSCIWSKAFNNIANVLCVAATSTHMAQLLKNCF